MRSGLGLVGRGRGVVGVRKKDRIDSRVLELFFFCGGAKVLWESAATAGIIILPTTRAHRIRSAPDDG